MLDKESLCSGQRHRERVLGHRLRICSTIGRYGHLFGQFMHRNEVDTSANELDEPRLSDERQFIRSEFVRSVPGEQGTGAAQNIRPRRTFHIRKIDDIGSVPEGVCDGSSPSLIYLKGHDQGEWPHVDTLQLLLVSPAHSASGPACRFTAG